MKILVLTSIFPNLFDPNRTVFIKYQVAELSKICQVKVIAPVPYLPRILRCLKRFKQYNVAKHENQEGIEVVHPRYFITPKIGRSFYGFFYFLSLLGPFWKANRDFKPDLILGFWVYPDGFATVSLARLFRKPVIIGGRGCDINLQSKYFLRRKMTTFALKRSNKVFSVSEAMKEQIIRLGISSEKIKVIPNGIDVERFRPIDKKIAREKLGLKASEKIVLFVGRLSEEKGIFDLLDAIVWMKNNILDAGYWMLDTGCWILDDVAGRDARAPIEHRVQFVIVGDGLLKLDFQERMSKLGISYMFWRAGRKSPAQQVRANTRPVLERSEGFAPTAFPCTTPGITVLMVGERPHDEIPLWMNASDVLCLPSLREGWPNVLMEALACGTFVVATRVGGVPEIIQTTDYGLLVPPEDPTTLAQSICLALEGRWDANKAVNFAKDNGWDRVAQKIFIEARKIVESTGTGHRAL